MSAGRRRDRRVYLGSHPLLFTVLSMLRRAPVLRLGRTVLVNAPEAYTEALLHLSLDRTAVGTTGGSARQLDSRGEHLFDQSDSAHRLGRRALTEGLGTAGVARLRPVWLDLLRERLAPLAAGEPVDLVPVAAELAGATTAALLGLDLDPMLLAGAARAVAAAAARDQLLPGQRRAREPGAAATAAVHRLNQMLAAAGDDAPAGIIAVAAVNTTVAALPRAAAWCADDGLWGHAGDPERRPALVSELLRVTAPSPVLPRAAAGPGTVGGRPVRAGDRLVLVARHAAAAHRHDPDPVRPAAGAVAQLVFGVGAHACPGAGLARQQLSDLLAALAPFRPTVLRSRVDRSSALPGWSALVVRAAG